MNVQSNQRHPAEENRFVQLHHSQIEMVICGGGAYSLKVSAASCTSYLNV